MEGDPYRPPQVQAEPVVEPRAVSYRRNELREIAWKVAALLLMAKVVDYLALVAIYGIRPLQVFWPVAITMGLALFAYGTSRRPPPSGEADNVIDGPILVSLQRTAFGIVGVICIAMGLWSLATALGMEMSGSLIVDHGRPLAAMGPYISGAVMLASGICLFFGAGGISRLWHALQRRGSKR